MAARKRKATKGKATKGKATKRKATKRKATKPQSGRKTARRADVEKEITLEQWFDQVRALQPQRRANTAAAEAPPTEAPPTEAPPIPAVIGACMIKNPNGGGKFCIQTTPAACKAMGGKFRGGACGG